MLRHNNKLFGVTLFLCVVGAAACDDNSDADDSSADTAGRVSRAGSGGSGGVGGSSGKGGSGGKDADAGKGGSASGGTEGSQECFDGTPSENDQFLNHCTDAECEPFDNAERLPLLQGGKLPPLP